MKRIFLLLVVCLSSLLFGCNSSSTPLPDPTNVKRTLPPGQKSQDVQMHIDK